MHRELNSFDRPLGELPTETITLGQYNRQEGVEFVKNSNDNVYALLDKAVVKRPASPTATHDAITRRMSTLGKVTLNTGPKEQDFNPYIEAAPFEEYPNE